MGGHVQVVKVLDCPKGTCSAVPSDNFFHLVPYPVLSKTINWGPGLG